MKLDETNLSGHKNRKVIFLHSEASKQTHRLHKERLVIGSIESADVRIAGDGVAPIHAVLELNHDPKTDSFNPAIYDLASESGVFVNGAKVVTHLLKEGDAITIGRHHLAFHLEDLARVSPAAKVEESSEGRKLFLNPEEDLKPLLLQDGYDIQQIFDYRPTHKPALEVVMSWMETILDVRHFADQKTITLGSKKGSDFGIPPVLSSSKYPLVTRTPGGYILHIDPKMRGVVQRKGELKALEDLRGVADEFGMAVGIEKDDFAKISIDDVNFYLSFTAAPPRLKPSKMLDRDPLMIKIFLTSLVLSLVTVTTLMKVHVPQNLDAEQIPERLATILYQTEKYSYQADQSKIVNVTETQREDAKAKPLPAATLNINPNADNVSKPVPKEMNVGAAEKIHKGAKNSKSRKGGANAQGEAKEGRGARARGDEGKRGSKTSNARGDAQNKAMRPSPDGGPGSGSGASQVPDEGNVDVLKGATSKIENILGNSAAALGKGGEKLKGFGGFNTVGNGGLAFSGGGKGGGGDANSTLGGLANQGRGGGRVGTGLGAAGNGNGIVGGQSRVVIRTGGPEEAVVMGAIDADAVEAALLAHKDEFRLCYEREINAENPSLAGRVGTSFVIGSSGHVDQAGVESTTLNNSNAERCILQVLKRIEFPIPRGAGMVQVSYPFKFTPVGH